MSSDTTLYNGPNWQLQVASNSKMTGNDAPVTAPVIWINSGAAPSDFPAATAGKIAMMNAGSNGTARSAQAANAVAAGAVGVVLVRTGQSPLNVGTLATAQPNVPVLGAGDMHGDELKKALCEGVNRMRRPRRRPAPTRRR